MQWQVAYAPSAVVRPARANTSIRLMSMNDSVGTRATMSSISSEIRSV